MNVIQVLLGCQQRWVGGCVRMLVHILRQLHWVVREDRYVLEWIRRLANLFRRTFDSAEDAELRPPLGANVTVCMHL